MALVAMAPAAASAQSVARSPATALTMAPLESRPPAPAYAAESPVL